VLPSGDLFIPSVTWSDVGVYRCVAVNPLTARRRVSPSHVNLLVQGLHLSVVLSSFYLPWLTLCQCIRILSLHAVGLFV